MQTYAILRRRGWRTPEELEAAAMRSRKIGDEQMPDAVRWIRSYALAEEDGTLGSVCIYQATDAQAIRRHTTIADVPVDDIVPVADTVIVQPDPEPAVDWFTHKLVALEDIVFKADWEAAGNTGKPSLFGRRFDYMDLETEPEWTAHAEHESA